MTDLPPTLAATRASWDAATAGHNAHKGDQAAFFRAGGDTLFDEELELLGPLEGRALVHLQCNAGQDTLSLARRGAEVVGVDFSREAVRFARALAHELGVAATFEEAEVVAWLTSTERRFDLAFTSYGSFPWIADLRPWARGIARVLRPGGRFVCVDFHPLVWSLDPSFRVAKDDYFERAPFVEPVGDYVAAAGEALFAAPGDQAPPFVNDRPATSWQHGVGELVTALAEAGLVVERLEEHPFSNGARVVPSLVPSGRGDRRWVFPAGQARVPLLVGLSARRASPTPRSP